MKKGDRQQHSAPRRMLVNPSQPGETAAEDVRNALAIVSLARQSGECTMDDLRSIEARLRSALRKIEGGGSGRPRVNPPAAGTLMSPDVMAVVYKHADDEQLYVHGFGNADLSLGFRGGKLIIGGLKETTNVRMFAMRDGTVTIAHRFSGTPIWQEFE